MAKINRSALLPYSAEKVYELINDVASYPRYMDGCVAAKVIEKTDELMVARLDLSKAGFRYSLTTRNRLEPPVSVKMELVDGPFERFSGCWTVKPLGDEACKVNLEMNFKLVSVVLSVAAKAMFNPMADNLVDALVKRAHYLYKDPQTIRR